MIDRNKFHYHVKLSDRTAGGAFKWLFHQDFEPLIDYDYESYFEIDTMFYVFWFKHEQLFVQFTLANWEDNVKLQPNC
jgi:hypothetical protein